MVRLVTLAPVAVASVNEQCCATAVALRKLYGVCVRACVRACVSHMWLCILLCHGRYVQRLTRNRRSGKSRQCHLKWVKTGMLKCAKLYDKYGDTPST